MKLCEFAEINPSVKLTQGEKYPCVMMDEITPGRRYVFGENQKIFSGGSKFQKGDVLFARITPCLENGKIAQFMGEGKGFGSTEYFIFRERKNISDQAFLFYLASSDIIRKPAEKSMFGASGRQRADLNVVMNIEVPAPPLPTQRRIADILSAYDDLIENNTRRIRILEGMAQAIYQEWFGKVGKESLPEGWKIVTVADLYNTASGGTPSRKQSEYFGGKINWVKTQELQDCFIFNTDEQITEDGLNNSSAKIFPKGTVLIALYGATIGKLGILALPASTNQACCALLPKEEIYGRGYAYFYFLANRQKIIALGAGAAQQNISQVIVKQLEILKPPPEVMDKFNSFVEPLLDMICSLQAKTDNLLRTRDLLLPRLVSGEVEV